MPGPIIPKPKPVSTAPGLSMLPDPMKQVLDFFFPSDSLPSTGAISLLPKHKVLENILNHVEDLKGTPYQAAAEELAERAPWVFGHIDKIKLNDRLWGGAAGQFVTKFRHALFPKGFMRGAPAGDVILQKNPSLRESPTNILSHETTHAAQALAKRPGKFPKAYQDAGGGTFGTSEYYNNKFEIGARKAGRKVQKDVATRTDDALIQHLLARAQRIK